MCLLSRYRWDLLDRRVCYLRLVKVFNTNAVHDSSKSPGSLGLLEDRRNGFYRALKFFFLPLDDSFAWSYLPLAVPWWAGAPAALRLLARWSRWPCLEGTYRWVTGVPTALWLHVCATPWWLRIYFYFLSYVSLTKVLPVDLLVCLEMRKDNVRR